MKKLSKNQKSVLKALQNPDIFKPSLRKIKEITGLKHNVSVIRACEALCEKGLVNDSYMPIVKNNNFHIDVCGTNLAGIMWDNGKIHYIHKKNYGKHEKTK